MAKKVTKIKAAAAAKNNLKAGKYSHNFHTRLTPDVGEKFEQIIKTVGAKTYNGCIISMINDYSSSIKIISDVYTQNENLKEQVRQQNEILEALKNANIKLDEYQKD